jgi:hypothetical protein
MLGKAQVLRSFAIRAVASSAAGPRSICDQADGEWTIASPRSLAAATPQRENPREGHAFEATKDVRVATFGMSRIGPKACRPPPPRASDFDPEFRAFKPENPLACPSAWAAFDRIFQPARTKGDSPMKPRSFVLFSMLLALLQGFASASEPSATPPSSNATSKAEAAARYEADLVAGLDRLAFMRGDWTVQSYELDKDGQWSLKRSNPLSFDWVVGHRFMEAAGMIQTDFRMTMAYNVREKTYQMALIDAQSGVLDVYSGGFDDNGKLVLTNANNFRWEITSTANGYELLYLHSADDGKTWKAFGRNRLLPAKASQDGD